MESQASAVLPHGGCWNVSGSRCSEGCLVCFASPSMGWLWFWSVWWATARERRLLWSVWFAAAFRWAAALVCSVQFPFFPSPGKICIQMG